MTEFDNTDTRTDAEKAENIYLWLKEEEFKDLPFTSEELARWTDEHTEGIYEALEGMGWSSDSYIRELLFEHAAYMLGRPYRHFFDRWCDATPSRWTPEEERTIVTLLEKQRNTADEWRTLTKLLLKA